VGSLLMRQMLIELHRQGTALSALYPATLSFYRRFGYLRAGQRLTYELPLDGIDVREHTGEILPVAAEHHDLVRQLYTQRARHSAGNLDRPDWIWQRRLDPQDRELLRFLVVCDGQPEGYVIYSQATRSDPLQILDLCVLTARAGRQVLTFFANYRSMVERMVWSGGPRDPLLYLLNENLIGGTHGKATITRPFEWMLRIVDLPAALSQRGYPPGISAELHLDLHDALLPANNGRWVLRVADGHGAVEAGGDGRIALDVAELAAIYSGFMAPMELRTIGALHGPDADLALLGVVFSGPQPWIADMF
jgi:predicted acetyltransferase